MDRGAWWDIVHWVAKSRTWLSEVLLVAQTVKNLPAVQHTRVWSLGWEGPLRMATHSSILAWRIPWTEKPGRLQSWGHKESCKHTHTQSLCLLWKIWESSGDSRGTRAQTAWTHITALPLTNWVTLSKILNLSGPLLPLLQIGMIIVPFSKTCDDEVT